MINGGVLSGGVFYSLNVFYSILDPLNIPINVIKSKVSLFLACTFIHSFIHSPECHASRARARGGRRRVDVAARWRGRGS